MEKNVHRGGFDPYYALFVYHIQRENYINIDVYVVNKSSRGIPWWVPDKPRGRTGYCVPRDNGKTIRNREFS